MLERFASVSTHLFGIDVKDMITYGYNILLINSRFERAFDEGRVILLPDSDDRPVTNKPVGYIKNWKIVVLDCHDLQWEGLRLGDLTANVCNSGTTPAPQRASFTFSKHSYTSLVIFNC